MPILMVMSPSDDIHRDRQGPVEKAERGEVILELSPLVLAETAFTLESFFPEMQTVPMGL
jgi:hypothetical protein